MKKMDSKLESVLQKVRGLLALSGNNPSQAEAQAAALKAQELIAKYNLTLTDVEKETQEIVTSEYRTGVDKSWKYGLARAVADNFRVMIYWVDRRVAVFYGYKQDTMIAVQVFEYLFKTGERGARAACRKCVMVRKRARVEQLTERASETVSHLQSVEGLRTRKSQVDRRIQKWQRSRYM